MTGGVLGWAARRAGFGPGGPASIGASAAVSAIRCLKPARKRASFSGWLRGREGGRTVFPSSEARPLRRAAAAWAAAALLAAGPLTWAAASGGLPLAGLGPFAAGCAMALAAAHRDYLAWTASEGRFMPPIDWIRRCPGILFRR